MAQSSQMQECIELCWECRTECIETFYNHCLRMGGKHVAPEHLKIMTDCIDACQIAADFMLRGSKFHASECATCAEICDACADSCETIGGEAMLRCASVCRECADACRQMGRIRYAA